MKKTIKLLSVFLALVLFMEAIPLRAIENEPYDFETVNEIPADEFFNTAPPEEETEAVENVEAEVIGELTEKREANVKHFRMSDGSVKAAIYPVDVHYEDENGALQDIDNTLLADVEEEANIYRNTANSFFVKFMKKSGDHKLYTIEIDGHKIKASIEGAEKTEAKLKDETESEEKLTGAPMAAENLSGSVTYENIFKNTDIQYTVISDRLKENIIINKKVDFGSLTYHYDIGNDLEAVEEENGTILIREKDGGKTVTVISAPAMWDANGRHSDELSLKLTEQKNGKITVVLTWDKEWVNSKETAFPVTVDPVLETTKDPTKIYDTYVHADDPNSSKYWLWEQLEVSEDAYTLLKFELPELSSGDKVINAELALAPKSYLPASIATEGYDPQVNITAHQILQSWETSSITYNSLTNTANFYNTRVEDYCSVECVGKYYTWDVTKLVDRWYDDNTIQNNGILLKYDKTPTPSGFRTWFHSCEVSSVPDEYYPQIIIQYINTTGIESYYSAHVQSAGKAGVIYTNDMTGNLTLINDIVTVGSGNAPITVSLVYNTNDIEENIYYGYGWRLNWTQSIKETDLTLTKDGTELKYYMYKDGDGTEHYFLQDSAGSMNATDEIHSTRKITYNSSTYDYVMSDDSGSKLYFKKRSGEAEWYLYKSEDVNGNYVLVTLDPSELNRIKKIESSSGYVVNFSHSEYGYLTGVSYDFNGSTKTTNIWYSGNGSTGNTCITDVNFHDGSYVDYHYHTPTTSDPYLNRYLLSVWDNGYHISYLYTKGGTTAPWRVARISEYNDADNNGEYAADEIGQEATMTYGLCSNTITDVKSGRAYLYTFSHMGTLKSVVDVTSGDGNGYGQYYEYNSGKEEIKGKGDLTFVSKTQKSTVNLFFDHSFETGDTFVQYYWGNRTSSYARLSSSKKMLGNYSLEVNRNDSCSAIMGCHTRSLTEGVTYTFSAYVNTASMNVNGSGGAKLIAYYNDGEYFQSEIVTEKTGSDEWKRIFVTFTTPRAGSISLCLALAGTTGTVYFDCAQLEVGGLSDYNLIVNGGFEWGSDGWSRSGGTTSATTTAVKLTGSRSLAMTSTADTRNDFVQTINVSGKKGDSYVLSAFAKTYSPSFDKDSAAETWRLTLLVRFYGTDGTNYDCNIHFNPDTSSWQKVSGAAVAKADYSRISVWILHYNNVNTVYFDNVQLIKDTFGNTYTYDDKGNVISTTDLAGKSEYTFTYDGASQLVKETNITGSKLFYAYNTSKKQQLVSVTGAGVTSSFAYDANGNATISKTTAHEILSGQSYYIRNYYTGEYLTVKNSGTAAGTNVTAEEFKGNSSQRWTLQKTGEVWALRPECASSLYMAADSASLSTGTNVSVHSGNIYSFFSIAKTDHGGSYSLKLATSTSANEAYCLTVKNGNAEVKEYSSAELCFFVFIPGAPVSTKTGHEAIYSGATYDSKGNVTSQTDSLGNTTGYTYLYDRGLVDSTVNAEGSKTYYTYNTNDQTTGITFEGGALTRSVSYLYNTDRLLQSITSPGGTVYNFTYDSFFRNTATTIGTSETPITLITNTYDNRGRLTRSIYGNNTKVENFYDSLDRLSYVEINDVKRYEYLYDGVGRTTETRDLILGKSVKYDYDLLDRLTKTSIIEGGYVRGEVSTEYDSKNRVSKNIADFGNKTLTTQFNYRSTDQNAVASVFFNGSDRLHYTYDKFGRIESKIIGGAGGINVSYEFLDGARIRNDDFQPSYSEGRGLFGDFDGDGITDACVISNLSGYFRVYVWLGKADGTFEPYKTAADLSGNADAFTGNVVVGNFSRETGEGVKQRDEIAILCRDSENYPVLYVLKKTNSSTIAFERSLWYKGENVYDIDPANVKNRMAAGDFDNDGQDEIAVLYAYTSSMSILVFDTEYATGSNLIDWDPMLPISSGDCDATKVTGRFVAGNFDGAGGDDIAMMYDTGNNSARIYVFLSNGTNTFAQGAVWCTLGENLFGPDRVAGTFSTGDYTGDGRDDLAMVYNYVNTANVFVFPSQGNSFTALWQNWHTGKGNYLYNKIKGRIGTVDNGDDPDSFIAIYPESESGYSIYRWDKKNNSNSFELNNTLLHTWNAEYYYEEDESIATSTVVKRETIEGVEYEYTYDSLGNVTAVSLVTNNGETEETTLLKKYTYDALGQMTSEYEADQDLYIEYTYDDGGNVTSWYSSEDPSIEPDWGVDFAYEDPQWKDLLTSYDGEEIEYDAIGNPTTYIGGSTLTWTDGRRLASFENSDYSLSFTYDMDGIRQTKVIDDDLTVEYFTSGSTILREERSDGKTLYFYYDDLGNLAALEYNNTMYYYVRNILGEILGLANSSGSYVAKYSYTAYGGVLAITDGNGNDVSGNADHIANVNPYRYKGYYYDIETEFYYLNSRYYNPMTARFINADGYVSTGQGFTGFNMFAYCGNNPVMFVDPSGNAPRLRDIWNKTLNIWNKTLNVLRYANDAINNGVKKACKAVDLAVSCTELEVGAGFGIGAKADIDKAEANVSVYADLINVRINNEGCLIGTKNYIGATIGAFNTSIGPEETQYTVHFKNFESVDSIIEYEPVTNAREDYDISFGIDAYIIVGFNVNICFKQDEFIVKWEEACSSD
ncbi:MAG: DNRLRE domain-containing protein [Ruminococcaceae bacterium]|nr:DNRLRE domain-containing protein [Oscillospiraceae bacterium]